MKTTLFVLCLLSATVVFAQSYGGAGYISSEPVIYQSPSHPAHAAYAAMSQEQSVVGGTSYASAQGERPASDFPQSEAASLGSTARELKQKHTQVKKSRYVWVNQ
jgi:hypothetical protein